MAGSLMQSAAGLLGIARQVLGVAVTYSRGESSIENITATRTAYRQKMANAEDFTAVAGMQDFLIAVADLVIDGQAVRPHPGDIIKDGGESFEVTADGTNAAWVYSDEQSRSQYRIHTIGI